VAGSRQFFGGYLYNLCPGRLMVFVSDQAGAIGTEPDGVMVRGQRDELHRVGPSGALRGGQAEAAEKLAAGLRGG
jgi:hypothetical protein